MKLKAIRLLCLLLCAAMLFGLLPPTTAEAAETTPATEEPVVEETTATTQEEDDKETIPNATDATYAVEEITEPEEENTPPAEKFIVSIDEAAAPTDRAESAKGINTEGTEEEPYSENTENQAINLGEDTTVIYTGMETILYTFTPEISGGYVFHAPSTKGNSEVVLELYIEDNAGTGIGRKLIGEDTATYGWLEAGAEYTLVVQGWNKYGSTCIATVRVDEYVEPDGFTLESVGSCVGEDIYVSIGDIQPEGSYFFDNAVVTWNVDDPNIAAITDTWPTGARLTAINAGTTIVTATIDDGISASCTVTVNPLETLDAGQSKTITLAKYETRYFSFIPQTSGFYVFHMANAIVETPSYTSYSYFDLSIEHDGISISKNAVGSDYAVYGWLEAGEEYFLSARGVGYEYSSATGTIYLDSYIKPAQVSLHADSTVYPGNYFAIEILVDPKNAYILGDVTWDVSDTNVVSISTTGINDAYFTAESVGTAVVTATFSDGVSVSYKVEVKAPEKIEPGQSKQLTLCKGETAEFTFTPKNAGKYVFHMPDGEYHPEEQFFENFSLAIYNDGIFVGEYVYNNSNSGVYCTMEAGVEYTLSAANIEDGDHVITGTVYFDVLQEATSFSLESYSLIYLGSRFSIQIENELPENAYVIDTTWSVSDPNVVSITDMVGTNFAEFLVVGEGTATITATASNGVSASYQVTVKEPEKWGALGSKTITLNANDSVLFSFTPEVSGEYLFTTPYDFNMDYSIGLSVIEDGINAFESFVRNSFGHGVYCTMEAGKEYLLRIHNGNNSAFTVSVSLEPYIEPESLTIELSQEYENSAYPADYPYLNPADYLYVGVYTFLDIIAYPESTYAAGITLTSSDPSIFSITEVLYGRIFSANKPGTVTITATTKGGVTATREVTVRDGVPLPILDGAESEIASGSPLTLRIDSDPENLMEVWVDGSKVSPEYYTVTEGSTIITIHPEYLKNLEEGYHYINVYFTDGWASTVFSMTAGMLGDVNGDGEINGKDTILLSQHLAGWDVTIDLRTADVNHDGKVDGKDQILLSQHLAGWDVTLG